MVLYLYTIQARKTAKHILLSLMLSPFSFGLSFFYTEEAPKYEVPGHTPPKIKPKPMACLSNNEMIQKVFLLPTNRKIKKRRHEVGCCEPWKAYSESFVERIDRFWSAMTGPSGPVDDYFVSMKVFRKKFSG